MTSMWRRLNYPLYLPESLGCAARILRTSGKDEFQREVLRLASLGSSDAAAVLGCLHLVGTITGSPNPDEALASFERAVEPRSPYLLYVKAWALWMRNERKEAMVALERAAVQGFPPAAFDLARFAAQGWGVQEPDFTAALSLTKAAAQAGHRASALLKYGIYRSGEVGLLRKGIGHVMWPFALIRYGISLRFQPRSERVFFMNPSANRPLFK